MVRQRAQIASTLPEFSGLQMAMTNKVPSLLERSVENLVTVLGVWHPRLRHRAIFAGAGDALVPILPILLVHWFGQDLMDSELGFDVALMHNFAGAITVSIVAATLAILLVRRGSDLSQIVVGILMGAFVRHHPRSWLASARRDAGVF